MAGGYSTGNSFALYETYNKGADWTEIEPSIILPGITDMAADTLNGEFVAYIATSGNGIYRYRAPLTAIGGKEIDSTPFHFELFENYPNPFNPSTQITYILPHSNFVTLTVYDLRGRTVQTLVSNFQKTGSHSINFDADHLASGIYFYQLKVGNRYSDTKKMILIR